MRNIKICVEKLAIFEHFPGIKEVKLQLAKLAYAEVINESEIEIPRSSLLKVLSYESPLPQSNMQISELSNSDRECINELHVSGEAFFKCVFDVLILLAEVAPLNTTDSVTMDEIKEKDKIYTSAGYLFDINTLIHFHNRRYLFDEFGRRLDGHRRPLLNINIGAPFSYRDRNHIELFIQKKKANYVDEYNFFKLKLERKQEFIFRGALACFLGVVFLFNHNQAVKNIGVAFLMLSVLPLSRLYLMAPHKAFDEEPLFHYQFS